MYMYIIYIHVFRVMVALEDGTQFFRVTLRKDIVLVEKDLFHEKKWSPSLVRLLQNKSALVEWQLSAYNLFKQLFRPSKLLHDAHVWDGGVLMQSSCQSETSPPNNPGTARP